MSGEDEKTAQVSSSTTPEAEAHRAESKAEEKEPVANGDNDVEEKDTKKATKRKAASHKKVKDDSDKDESDEDSKKSPKKKALQSKKSPVKKQKKEVSTDEDDMEDSEPKKTVKQSSPKRGRNVKIDEEEDENEEDEEEEEPKKKGVPLLDQPLEIEGSRARKTVARFSFNNVEKEEKKPFSVPEGKGTRLGDIPRIEHFISKIKTDEMKPLSKALFGARGPVKAIVKKSVRNFSGYDFDENSEQWEKRSALLSKLKLAELKTICAALDLERSGTVINLTERIMKFCLMPTDSGKKLKTPKRKSKGDSKSSRPKRSTAGKAKSKVDKDLVSDDDDADDNDDDDDNGGDEAEEVAKKSSRKVGKAKKSKEESSADEKEVGSEKETEDHEEDDDKPKAASEHEEEADQEAEISKAKSKKPKKASSRKVKAKITKKKKAEESEEDKSDLASSAEDDEPLVKISKPTSPPTDEDIKTYVKQVLMGANLEEITMKTVCKQVYEHYPDHDLAHKKDLIKETVKSLISN